MGGQIIDATIVTAPKQPNKRAGNEAVKAGETPREWKDKPAKNRHKDKDARWTKKHGRSYFGCKNHVNVDRRHKFIRRYDVTSASARDGQKRDGARDQGNTASDVWAGRAHRGKESAEKLRARGLQSRVCRRGARGRPLAERRQEANRTRAKARARGEHVLGQQTMTMGAKIARAIGMAGARMQIGMRSLADNMRRFVTLERVAAATA